MQLVNTSVDPVDDALFSLHESVGLHAHAFVFFFQTDGVDFHRLGLDVKLCGEVEDIGRFFEDGDEAGKVVERDSCLFNLSVHRDGLQEGTGLCQVVVCLQFVFRKLGVGQAELKLRDGHVAFVGGQAE